MSKIWFCRNCGYEVASRGRCHACKARLSTSPLPELPPGDEDDEVGYRLQDWTDRSRATLIVRLIEANILHRFEDEELVVGAGDEERTDDLVEEVSSQADLEPESEEGSADGDPDADDPVRDEADEQLVAEVEALFTAARRLRADPTDMQADSDLAHASAMVFIADGFFGVDAETWAAVGRTTRRLLGALGAEEALEEEITLQAGILVKLLDPLVGVDLNAPPEPDLTDAERQVVAAEAAADAATGPDAVAAEAAVDEAIEEAVAEEIGHATPADDDAAAADDAAADDTASADDDTAGTAADDDTAGTADDDTAGTADDDDDTAGTAVDDGDVDPVRGESVYELPEWLPEQRAQLSLYLDEKSIGHTWEGGDLVVPIAAEGEVEALFDRVDGVSADDDDGARYRALEDLFAAASRFVSDPDSRAKRQEVVRAVANADGPTPLGLDDADWWSIRSRARLLADSIEHDASLEVIFDEATTLRDMLRVLV